MTKPLLSIGIIFKNEIRCLERCLKSLCPLRDAVSCEVVMADTGSDDGSREVAERYADLVFDFPWIDDFAAARNAVMDRCSGDWYLSIDADEWLDPDIKELLTVFGGKHEYDYFRVTIHNYKSKNFDADSLYMDSSATRLARMSTGTRYHNAIHESLETNGQPVVLLRNTLFYHDGYVYLDSDSRKSKEERNLLLLHKELEERPDDLSLLIQCFESSYEFPEEHMDYLRKGMELTAQEKGNWRICGPVIFRYAVATAFSEEFPEIDQWIVQAEERFPNSIMTRVDVNHTALAECWNREDYVGCIRRGEAYFQGVKDYETGHFNVQDISGSPLIFASMELQQTARSFLAGAYFAEHQMEKCMRTLEEMFRHMLNEEQMAEGVRTLVRLYAYSRVDTKPLVLALWEQVNEPVPSPEVAKRRLEVLDKMGYGLFRPDFSLGEKSVLRPAYGLFLPLEDKCDLGRAAALYGANSLPEVEEKLAKIKDLDKISVWVLSHAIQQGAQFPDRPMNLEEMDALASRLAQTGNEFVPLALDTVQHTDPADWRALCWTRGLLMAAVQTYLWNGEGRDKEQGMALARAFARVEREFLPRCYAADVLQADMLFALPPVHRFGWYCAQAFDALDSGDGAGYVRLLREGLESCESMKPMVEFLLDNTPELQVQPEPSAELKALADQIRTVLANFSPNDPAVMALKQSEAYQKVAYLIEGTEVPVLGGLKQ